VLREFAAKKGATPARLALGWPPAQKPFVAPTSGTRKSRSPRREPECGRRPAQGVDLRELNAALASGTVHGGRINAEQMTVVETH
jgi:hypothetical protein